MKKITIITGKQNVGKSTLARKLAENSKLKFSEINFTTHSRLLSDINLAVKEGIQLLVVEYYTGHEVRLLSLLVKKVSIRKPYSAIVEEFPIPNLIVIIQDSREDFKELISKYQIQDVEIIELKSLEASNKYYSNNQVANY